MRQIETIKARVLLIEGKRRDTSFAVGLTRKGFQVTCVPNGAEALNRMEDVQPHVVIIDAVSLRTSGRRICLSLRQNTKALPIVMIVPAKTEAPEKLDVNAVLSEPFTLQKLVNRLRPFLPTDQKDTLQFGAIQLDADQRLVRCEDRQSRLTPRLVTLLRIFMEHPGDVIDRKDLFRQVWDTTYTVDTRTLDVHISWLRQAIEKDPRNPQYIKTIRGVGYRLDTPEVY